MWWSRKGPSFWVFLGVFYSLEVDGLGVVASSGEAARDPVGVLPSASSFSLLLASNSVVYLPC